MNPPMLNEIRLENNFLVQHLINSGEDIFLFCTSTNDVKGFIEYGDEIISVSSKEAFLELLTKKHPNIYNFNDILFNPSDGRKTFYLNITQENALLVKKFDLHSNNTNWKGFSLLVSEKELNVSENNLLNFEEVKNSEFIEIEQEVLKRVLNNSPLMIFVKDINNDFRFVFVNQTFANFFNKKPEDLVGKNDYELGIAPELVESYRKQDLEVLNLREAKQFENYSFVSDEKQHYIVNKFPIFDKSNQIKYLCGIAQDISQVKELEIREQDNNFILTESQKLADFGSWVYQKNSGKYLWSDNMYQIFEIPNNIEIDLNIFKRIVYKEDFEFAVKNMEKLLKKEISSYEHSYRIKTDNGKIKHIFTKAKIEKSIDGDYSRVIGISRDVTEIINYQSKILETQNTLLESQQLGKSGNWIFNFQTKNHFFSDYLYIIYDIDKNSQRLYRDFRSRIHPKDEPILKELEYSIFHSNESEFALIYRILTKVGELRYIETIVKTIRDNNGVLMKVIGTSQDITERKTNEDLRRKLIADLIQKNKDLNQFNYIISHNLRAPVANMKGLSSLLSSKPEKAHRNEEIILNIQKSAINLDKVIIDLNDILAIRAKIDEAKELIFISDLIQNSINSLHTEIEKSGATIKIENQVHNKIKSIPSYLESILYQLLSNSIKYRNPHRPLQIEVLTKIENNFLKLIVKDNGSGINLSKYRNKLFNIYQRFTQSDDGRGLGLYLVKVQTEALNGRVDVESEENNGTTFSITIKI